MALSERFELRLDEDILERIDNWRGKQAELPTRAEAMRRLVESGLAKASSEAVKFSPGEKLIIAMLCDVSKHLKIGRNGINADLVSEVISGGHYWALKWELQHILHDHEDDPQNVTFVVDVLDMWDFIEIGYQQLSKKDKDLIAKEGNPLVNRLKFRGFDDHGEIDFTHIARFLIEKLGRFSTFKGRDLNSHMPMVAKYRRMFRYFEPIRATLIGQSLSASQIIEILKAGEDPELASRRASRKGSTA